MSDFLSNLIARSRGDLTVIRPRVPSLYEPRSQASLSETFLTAGSGNSSEFEQDAPSALPYSSISVHSGKVAEASAAEISQHDRDEFGAILPLSGSQLPRQRGGPAVHSASPKVVNGSFRNRWNLPGSLSSAPQPAQRGSDGTTAAAVGENRPAELRAAHRSKASDVEPRLNRGLKPNLPAPSSFSSGSGNFNSPASSRALHVRLHQAIGLPRAGRGDTDRGQRVMQRSRLSEAPINITIGRVEVRAVTPAPPARRTAPSKSRATLSLDDYLKRRNGGRG